MDHGSLVTCSGGQRSAPMDTQSHTHNGQGTSGAAVEPFVDLTHLLFSQPARFVVALRGFLRIKHLTTALPFLSKHNFSCYLSYFFCYKTCTGCLEQQQKYNIQFICNFFHSMIIDSSWVDPYWSSVVCLIVPMSKKFLKWCPIHFGRWRWRESEGGAVGRNKYRGQDVAEAEQEFCYSLTPDNST